MKLFGILVAAAAGRVLKLNILFYKRNLYFKQRRNFAVFISCLLLLTLSANEASSSSNSDLEGRKFSDKQNFLTGNTEKWDEIRTTEMEDLANGADAWFS